MSNPPDKTASTPDCYMDSLISLISKSEIRYQGIMYYLNPQDSTIALKNVRSFGTEGRKKDGPQILPSDKVYEYILFRGSDIKDLQVKSSPAAQLVETLPDDPAIIQSHCAGGLPNSSKSLPVGGSSSGSGASNDISALNLQPRTSFLPPQQSGSQVEPLNHHPTQVVNSPSHALPMSWSGYSGVSGNNGSQNPTQYANPSVPAVSNPLMTSSNQLSPSPSPSPSPFNFAVPESNFAPFNLPPSCTSNNYPIKDLFCSTSNLPSTSLDSPLPSYPAKFVGNRLSPSLVSSSSSQDRNSTEVGRTDRADPGSVPFLPVRSSYPISSVVDSSSSFSNHPKKLITPDQISQPRSTELSPSPIFFLDQGDVGAASSSSSNFSFPITSPAAQPPLLPLPPLAQKLHYSPAIGEEFDFEAMNEKFKKDEIWGHLGKAKQGVEGVADTEDVRQMIGNGSLAVNVKANMQPAYKKDDFFDSISCNSLSRGGRNGHRFSEQMKLDTETFGNYQQRIHPNFVAHGPGRGHYSRGMRHHHYSVRGRGRGRYSWT